MNIQLLDAERKYLEEHLNSELWKLREEILRTDSLSYKEMLHKKEAILEGLSKKVASLVPAK